jgi:uncharacterized membrane protein YdjX (TVP38/TMEM64 family)
MLKPGLILKLSAILLLGVIAVLAFTHQQESVAQIRSLLQQLDPATAALIFIGLCIVAALAMFPVSVLFVISGAYFGLWAGFALNLLGFITGAVITFLISRHLARDLITRLLPPRALAILEQLGNHGWKTVAVLRAIGVIPGVLVNYAIGLTTIPLRTYIWASLVFTMPNDFILTYAGVAGEAFINGGDLRKLTLAASLIVVAAIAGYLLRKRIIKS